MEDAFFFNNGESAHNIEDLRNVLVHAPEGVTARHVTAEKNDYASWIHHVLGENALAREVQGCHDVHGVVIVLNEFLTPHPEPVPIVVPEVPAPVEEKPVVEEHHDLPQHKAPEHHPPPLIKHEKKKKHHYARDFIIGLVVGIVLAIIAYQLVRLL